jgi:gliding motility-associated-like protein
MNGLNIKLKQVYWPLAMMALGNLSNVRAQSGCPFVDAGNAQEVNCNVNCVNLTADFLPTGATTSYTVESIPYVLPVPMTGGTPQFIGADDIWGSAIALPFNFCFYGNMFNQVVIGANGLVSFDVSVAGTGCLWSFTESIPHPNLYGNSIMGAYHDIDPGAAGALITLFPPTFSYPADINYVISGSAPCRIFAVSFANVPHYNCNTLRTYQQIVIYETTNIVEVYIQDKPTCAGWNGGRAVIGLQNANGTAGISPPGRNTGNWTASNEAWRFIPAGTPNYQLSWYEGGNLIGNTPTINVCPSATTTYTSEVIYTACDGNVVTVTDQVTVTQNSSLNVTVTPATATLCAGESVSLTASSPTPGLTYTWTPAAGLSATTGATVSATPGATQTYTVSGSDGSCAASANATITVNSCVSCSMTAMSLAIADCYTTNGQLQYDVSGTVNYTNPPTTGTLTVTNCLGQQQVFNPPFGTSRNFTFTGLPQNGQSCDFTAVFSDDPTCTFTSQIAAPPTITFYNASCAIGSGTVSGTVEFINPPTTGTLVISINDGTGTQQSVLQPPFVSPAAWTVNGLDPTAGTYTITYYFSDFAGCGQTQTVTCGCNAEAGSTTVAVNGVPTLTPVLCEDDVVTILTNGNFIHPDDEGPIGGFAYQPALVYVIFNCPPTPGLFPGADPCLVGIIPVPENIGDVNDANSLVAQVPPGTFTNGQVYIAAITLYHFDPVTPNFIVNTNCWDLGTVFNLTYLQPITSSVVESCPANTVTVTLSGGRPANNGSVFTASNLLPANASFANTTAPNNGSIVINGLLNGDIYSFDVTDASGCAHTVTGGPFTTLPIADAGTDGTSCSLSYQLSPNPSWGTGTWSGGPVGTTFAPNANTANATVTVPSTGNFTFTWTEVSAPGCSSSDDVVITFDPLSIPAVVTGATCGQTDGEIVVAPQGGTAPYSYAWTSGGNGPVESNLGAGPVTVTVTDATGCSLDSTFIITLPNTFTFTTDATDVTCFGDCNGTASVAPVGPGPFTYQWSPSGGTGASASNLCAGSYTVEITEDAGCVQTTTIVIGTPSQVDAIVNSDETTICIGQTAQLSAQINGGTPPYSNFQWTAVPADPSLQATQQNPTVSPVVTTTYSFVAVDANGCASAPKQVTVTVRPPLSLTITRPLAGGDTTICLNDFATINLTAAGGDGAYSYFLLPNTNTPITLPLNVQPSATTTYDFIVTDGCTTPPAMASSTVTVLPLPVVNFSGDVLEGCDVHTVQFTDLTLPSATQWTWNFGDANAGSSTASAQNPFHQFSGPGSYDISLNVVTANGCTGDTTFPAYVTVHAVPTAHFDLTPTVVNLLNAHIDFTDNSQSNIATWAWNFGDGSTSSATNPSHTYSDTGTYVITLNVTTIYGCTDQTEGVVIIEPDFTFYIPNAFTPNNNRKNEDFRPYGEGVNWDTYELRIFTRWGQQIYYTVDIDSPWDGSYKGAQVENDVYVYRIGITDLKGERHEYTGRVTLLR